MTATPKGVLKSRLKTLEISAGEREPDENTISDTPEPLQDPADADAIRAFIDTYNPNNLMKTPPSGDSTLTNGSCGTYLSRLTEAARRISLTDATADDVNGILQTLMDGGSKPWTVHGYSTAFKKFYGFHDFGPDPDEITSIDTPRGSSFDPKDMLTREEIHQLLDAADNPRDRAVFALLIYTGMRNNALRTLRVGDVNPHEGVWKANDEMPDGLKGLDKYGNRRPLLGAVGPLREWLRYHTKGGDPNPDHYLITGLPKYGKADPTSPVDGSTIRRVMDRLVDAADNPAIDRKPTNPHMMRHNFVTVCKRDYGLPDETVKFLIGHSPTSNVMETTYAHLSDDDHIQRAEEAAGIRDPEEAEESPLTPDVCICGEPLPKAAKACSRCGAVYTPDAHAVADQLDADVKQSYAQTHPEDTSTQDKVEVLDNLLADPEVKQALLEKLNG